MVQKFALCIVIIHFLSIRMHKKLLKLESVWRKLVEMTHSGSMQMQYLQNKVKLGGKLSPEGITQSVATAGVNADAVKTCMDSGEMA